MTLLFADGFEDGLADWAIVSAAVSTNTPRNGSNLLINNNNGTATRSFTPSNTVIIGFAFRAASFSALGSGSGSQILNLIGDTNSVYHTHLSLNTGGQIQAFMGNTVGVNVLGTASQALSINTWYYLEFKATLHDTLGSVVLHIDGIERLNVSGVDTRNGGTVAAYDTVRLFSNSSTNVIQFDDLYICNNTGSYNNDFLGDLAVEHIRPTGNDTSQWVGSDADSVNNYALVNEAGAAVTTTYVGSPTVGNRDLYTTPGSVRGIGNVYGVYAVANMAKSDAGAKSAALCIKEGSGGTPRTGTSQALTTGYLNYGQAYDRKADGSAWTFADLQALRIGTEVTA